MQSYYYLTCVALLGAAINLFLLPDGILSAQAPPPCSIDETFSDTDNLCHAVECILKYQHSGKTLYVTKSRVCEVPASCDFTSWLDRTQNTCVSFDSFGTATTTATTKKITSPTTTRPNPPPAASDADGADISPSHSTTANAAISKKTTTTTTKTSQSTAPPLSKIDTLNGGGINAPVSGDSPCQCNHGSQLSTSKTVEEGGALCVCVCEEGWTSKSDQNPMDNFIWCTVPPPEPDVESDGSNGDSPARRAATITYTCIGVGAALLVLLIAWRRCRRYREKHAPQVTVIDSNNNNISDVASRGSSTPPHKKWWCRALACIFCPCGVRWCLCCCSRCLCKDEKQQQKRGGGNERSKSNCVSTVSIPPRVVVVKHNHEPLPLYSSQTSKTSQMTHKAENTVNVSPPPQVPHAPQAAAAAAVDMVMIPLEDLVGLRAKAGLL